ncbi:MULTISPECIES: TAXI family TRAP transporter solute-binding subunit [unclassified Haladaptatus]|uniref:TAXI family TRAP transporter solute-binding subunit n=1 Tax=unclassified Haladaptatus TaxID=2622732 RepID=UPI0023E8BFA3|nr:MULTISPECIES: TAXI family TRAP transporter solute-binding subunit [unclassified Haladaptatus]
MVRGNSKHGIDRRRFLKSTAGVAAAAAIAGCSGGPGGSGDEGGDGTQFVTIGTGGTGGVYYPLGGGMADIMNKNLENVEATAESTGASVENCRLVADEEMTMALALGNAVLLAVNGEGDFDEALDLKAAFGAYQNSTQVITTQGSGIETIPDMEGKSISVGAPGSGTEVIAKELLNWYDLTYDDIDAQRLSFSETATAIQDGQVDAGFWSVAYPASSIQNLASQRDIAFVTFPEEDLNQITSEYDYYSKGTIPAGTYQGVDEEVQVPGVTNTMIVRSGMSEDFVYKLTKAVFEHLDSLADVHPAANQFESTARAAPIELHPGSVKYFDEAGL